MRRFLEQGSDYAVMIVRAPGLEARKIEHLAGSNYDLTLQIRNSFKLKNLKPEPKEMASEKLMKKFKSMEVMIDSNLKNTDGERLKPEILDLTKYYGRLKFGNIEEFQAMNDKEFGGEIVSIKGSLVIVKHKDRYFALDSKTMISKTFTWLDRPAKMQLKPVLNNWF